MSSPLVQLLLGAFLCASLVVAPGAWLGRVPALRYSAPVAVALAAIALTVISLVVLSPQRRQSRRLVWALAALLGAKVALGYTDTPAGWRAEYVTVTPDPPKIAGFAWRLGYHPYRIDAELTFDARTFELQFFNDLHRYNARQYAPPRSTSQELRVAWTGWFDAATATPLTVTGVASGRISTLVDGRAWFSAEDERISAAPPRDLAPGRHRLDVIYEKPSGRPPAVSLSFALDGAPLATSPWPAAPESRHRVAGYISDGLVAAGLGVFGLQWFLGLRGARLRGTSNGRGAWLAGAAACWLLFRAVTSAAAFNGSTLEFTPGDDHLAYEGLSRNILEEGILMPEHRPVGQGTAFFFYPLYSYVLAGAHLVLGDSHATVVFLNAAAAAAIPVVFWLLGWRHLPTLVQGAGQLLLLAFITRHHARYFESPLTDNLFIPLVVATLVLAIRAVRTSRPLDAFLTGCAVAACATTRPSAFLLIPLLALLIAWTSAGTSGWRRAAPIAALAGGYAVALAPVVIRNWVMARQAVAMVTLSHAIPISLIPPEGQTPEALKRAAMWTWSESLQLAGSMIAADPWGIAWLEARKILFTLGLTSLGPAGSAMIWELPILAVAGLAAFGLRRLPATTSAVLLTFVVSHLAAITLAYPWTYGYKTILPVHLVFLFAAMHLFNARHTPQATSQAEPPISSYSA